jgi:hypothetical protein
MGEAKRRRLLDGEQCDFVRSSKKGAIANHLLRMS